MKYELIEEYEEYKIATLLRELECATQRLKEIYHYQLHGQLLEAYKLEEEISDLKKEIEEERKNNCWI